MSYYKFPLKQAETPVKTHTGVITRVSFATGKGTLKDFETGKNYHFTVFDIPGKWPYEGHHVVYSLIDEKVFNISRIE